MKGFLVMIFIVATLLTFGYQSCAQNVDLDRGLIAHYTFNGDANDQSPNAYNGQPKGAELVEDRFGNCKRAYAFDNSPELISIPREVLNDRNSFSVSIWIRTLTSGVAITAANEKRDNEFFIQILPGGKVTTTVRANPRLRGQRVDGNVLIADDKWHHVVVTRNHGSGDIEIYIDGQLDVRTNTVFAGGLLPRGPLEVDVNGLHIGADQDCVGGCWDANQQMIGSIDDVWFFDRVLNEEEVIVLRDSDRLTSPPSLMLPRSIESCQESFVLNAGDGFDRYVWSTGETGQFITVSTAGTYTVTSSYLNCEYTSSTDIRFLTKSALVIDATSGFIGCNGREVSVSASGNFDSYVWSNGMEGDQIKVSAPGAYYVIGKSVCGDVKSESIEIYGNDLDDFFIPNTFTPNGDGINDTFEIDVKLIGASIVILNRWGKKLFESQDYQNDWAGLINNGNGVFYYRISHPCLLEDIKGWVQTIK